MLLFSVLGFPHSWGSDCVMLLFSMVDLSLKPVVYLKRATSREICLFFLYRSLILTGSEFMVFQQVLNLLIEGDAMSVFPLAIFSNKNKIK